VEIDPTQLLELISDHAWPGWQSRLGPVRITWMSSGIAAMILVGLGLIAFIVPVAQRRRLRPHGAVNVLEVLVVFVRDMIARPTLGERAYDLLPFLLTLFVFVLGLNLFGLLPLEPATDLLGYPIGGVATSIPMVCVALAGISLLTLLFLGLRHQVMRYREQRGWPLWLCAVLSPALWVGSLSPRVPGVTGTVLLLPLAVLELFGVLAKCFSLLVRLFANMLSGHTLLALLMMFFLEGVAMAMRGGAFHVGYVGPFTILGSVVINVLELLVAGLQAYVFTFLTAMYVALYVESAH